MARGQMLLLLASGGLDFDPDGPDVPRAFVLSIMEYCTKYDKMILTKIIKIVATMSDFTANMHKIRFRLGLCPRPRWGSLQRFPRSLDGGERADCPSPYTPPHPRSFRHRYFVSLRPPAMTIPPDLGC